MRASALPAPPGVLLAHGKEVQITARGALGAHGQAHCFSGPPP